ncbi:protein HEG homolog 1 isoform X1 [Microtus ochrogaster]|uniref:Protein HEG homolog 1 isoform X1 n=1 Tax=Microtus ochrogaster TaxID=79684 RepID=A0ABM1ARQ9_MICOH|nr:protein HEG homolog 1 isoform X1 [Microtus ochrogaster]
MASPRAPRWPPPLPLVLLLLLLPPPATPRMRGPLLSPANRALLPAVGPPSPLGPGHTAPGPGVTTRRGRSGRIPRGVNAVTARSHGTESNNTEPDVGNTPFYQSQEDHSGSRKGVTAQTARLSHSSSDASGNPSFLPETNAEGRIKPSSGAMATVPHAEHTPEMTTALATHGSSLSSESLPRSSSSSRSEGGITVSQTESGISPGFLETARELPEEGTVHTQVAGIWVSSQASLPALELREPTMFSQKRNSSGQEHSELQFPQTQSQPPPSGHPSSSGSIKNFNDSANLQSLSVTQTKSTHVTNTFTDGVTRMLWSLTVSVEPVNETESLPAHSRIAVTSASVPSPPSVGDSRTDSRLTERPGDGEGIEPSIENGVGIPSIHWQSDSPTFGGHQLAGSPEAGNGSATPLTEIAFRPVPSIADGASTGQWFPAKSKTSTDTAESSALHPDTRNPWVRTPFSHTAQQPRGGGSRLGRKNFSESSSSASSESLDSSATRGEHSIPEDSVLLSYSSDRAGSTSGVRSPNMHTSTMLTRSGERTLRSLGLSHAATHPVHPSLRGNVTEHAGLLSRAPTLGVTELNQGPERGSDAEPRPSSDHTDHAYASSAFTKGERSLLSITENSSSSDTSESATSSAKISDSPRVDFSSSQGQTKRSNASSYDGEPAQSSTKSLVLLPSNLPSPASTVNVPNTLVLGASTKPVEDPSESEAPWPLPSESPPHRFSATVPSTGSPTQQLKSTSDTATPSSSSLSPLPVSFMVSTLAPHSVSQATFPRSSSTLVPHRAREPRVTSVQMSTVESAIAMFPGNQTADPKNQSAPQPEKAITEAQSLPTDPTQAVTMSLPPGTPWSPALMGFSTEPALPATSTSLAQMSPALMSSTSQTPHSPATSPSTLSGTEALTPGVIVVHITPEKPHLPTSPEIPVPQTSTEGALTTEGNRVQMGTTTYAVPLTTTPTSAGAITKLDHAEEASPVSPSLRPSSPQTTSVSTAEMLTSKYTTIAAQSTPESPTALSPPAPVNSCTVNPCLHDGECIVDFTVSRGYRCVCPPAWQGDNCSVDVNECLSSPCPPLAMCNNTQGSFTCRCPVGYQLEKGICNLVRTFVTEFKLKKTFLNTTVENHSDAHEVENKIAQTLNLCFSTLPGYIRSTVRVSREPSTVVISLQSTFALASNVTLFDLADGIQKYVNSCRSSAEVCQLLGSQRRIFRAGSLCKRKSPECDKETSICTDLDGVALCQCKSGYFQFNKMDHSCRACEDGYRLENETCMSCPFGLGGLNCGNPYQLITVVIAAAGGGLLLILGIALIVTCCRKSKNDISKLIFKSGDFQMSPYAEYPKNPRSQEWGREAIEMHENGSTKNLLQMTDVYYSPTNVRNPELERNGLYPAYTGLPGSRHSCIFPGQYNPSFISDESRRRDYF